MAARKKTIVQYRGLGRRKRSTVSHFNSGTGKITVNGRDVNDYMPYETLVMDLNSLLH